MGAIKKRQKELEEKVIQVEPPIPTAPKTNVLLPPPLPPAKLPSRIPSTVVTAPVSASVPPTHVSNPAPVISAPVSAEEERRRLRSELPTHFTFDCISEGSDSPLIPPLPSTPSDHSLSPSHVVRKTMESPEEYSEPRRLTTHQAPQLDTQDMEIDSVAHQREVLREYIPQQNLSNL